MAEILLFLGQRLAFLLDGGRFRITDSDESFESFGNAHVTLEGAALRFRLLRERGKLFMELQAADRNPDEWFSIGVLRGVLLGDRGGSEELDKGWAAFVRNSLDEVDAAFADPQRRSEMIAALHEQERLRALELT